MLVQNRVAIAEPRLPEEVRRLGVTTLKSSPDLLMVVHLISPDNRYDQLYIGNYALIQVRDTLARVDGVGDVTPFGLREYSMRIWLDPERMAHLSLTPGDVLGALREQNIQVASGVIGQATGSQGPGISNHGQHVGPAVGSRPVRQSHRQNGRRRPRRPQLTDVARIELGARDYTVNSYLNNETAVALVIAQRPGSNALATSDGVEAAMEELSKNFPEGLEYRIVYNPTIFVRESINSVIHTLFEAVVLGRDRRARVPADLASQPRATVGNSDFAHRHVRRDGRRSAFRSTCFRYSAWCSRLASSSTTRSWSSRTLSDTLPTASRRGPPPTRPWMR